MYPTICKIGPLTVYSYGLMLAIAFMSGAFLASRQAYKINIKPEVIFNLCFLVFVSGVIGARFFFVGYHFFYYLHNPIEVIMLQQGGLSWFGGLMLGTVSGLVYLKKKKLPVAKTMDLLAPYLALAQAIGRIGCFLNGCCFGKIWRFGIYFPSHEATLIPTQLYSSLALIVIFFILRLLRQRPHCDGQIFSIYLLLYCAKRFLMEFLRADNPAFIFGLTIFQFFSLAGFTIALVSLIFIARANK